MKDWAATFSPTGFAFPADVVPEGSILSWAVAAELLLGDVG